MSSTLSISTNGLVSNLHPGCQTVSTAMKNGESTGGKKGEGRRPFTNVHMLPPMTPRSLVPPTPLRSAPPLPVTAASQTQTVKGPRSSGHDRSHKTAPLAPGYVDRALQRRAGQNADAPAVFDWQSSRPDQSHQSQLAQLAQDGEPNFPHLRDKHAFLHETAGQSGFPVCKHDFTERLLLHVLKGQRHPQQPDRDAFKPGEAFLVFKSLGERHTLPFHPFYHPRRVFRSSATVAGKDACGVGDSADNSESAEILLRVKTALLRLRVTNEASERHIKALRRDTGRETAAEEDIFPETGRFDEKAALHDAIRGSGAVSAKVARSRIFSKKHPAAAVEEESIFDLIAQQPLDQPTEVTTKPRGDEGGLFGYGDMLPKLSRLADTGATPAGKDNVYSALLDGDEEDGDEKADALRVLDSMADDVAYYPGAMESAGVEYDSDDEPVEREATRKRPGTKQPEDARKQARDVDRVERLFKSKYNVDLGQ